MVMAIPGYSITTASQFVGRALGISDWVALDQDCIDVFAACTGDRQWIHVDVDRARLESPFGGTIAHGYLTLSLVAATAMELGVIPHVRNHVSLLSAEPQAGGRTLLKLQCTLEIEGEAKPALVAEMLCMLIGKACAGLREES